MLCKEVHVFSVSRRLNEVRGAHDDEQQSAQPGARREARAAGREKAHVATCVQTPRIKITQLSTIR